MSGNRTTKIFSLSWHKRILNLLLTLSWVLPLESYCFLKTSFTSFIDLFASMVLKSFLEIRSRKGGHVEMIYGCSRTWHDYPEKPYRLFAELGMILIDDLLANTWNSAELSALERCPGWNGCPPKDSWLCVHFKVNKLRRDNLKKVCICIWAMLPTW